MKKILSALIVIVFVWGCTKKMTPATSGSPASNTGSLINNNSTPPPASTDPNMGKGNAATSTTTTTTNDNQSNSAAGSRSQQVNPTATSPEAAAVMAGMQTYNAKCGTCHGLKVTTNYTSDRWASILAVMAPKARLTEDEKNNVFAYVKENSKK
jgi:mono/diheme cytochrome c family protein